MPEAVIVSTARSPIGRAGKGSLKDLRPDELARQMIATAIAKVPELNVSDIEDIHLGIGQPGGAGAYNIARSVAVQLGLDHVPGVSVNRYCSSSLQTTRMALHAIKAGEGDVFIEGEEGAVAVGLSFDKRANTLFVSGGPTGLGRVYDASSGALLAEYQLGTPGATFINDVVATREAAYFTDSRASVFYRVPLGPGGRLLPNAAVETIAFSDNYPFDPAAFNSNGIVATSNGRWLIVANSGAQAVYRVDPDTGEATEIDLGGDALPNADGLVLLGRTLYVVQNSSNQIAVVELSADYTSGEVVDTITDDDFRVPTTAAVFGNALYAVNARFGTTPGPDVEYEIVRVER